MIFRDCATIVHDKLHKGEIAETLQDARLPARVIYVHKTLLLSTANPLFLPARSKLIVRSLSVLIRNCCNQLGTPVTTRFIKSHHRITSRSSLEIRVITIT